jgi:S-adenosylmethionine hydrolase
MRHITLLTDFGTTEGEHTVLKGVIWSILPGAHIADLSHTIRPQNIREGALVLERTAHYFPPETVHIVVIDPGVGTDRKAIAAQFGNQFFVGPDNGVSTPLLTRAKNEGGHIEIVHLDNPKYWLEDVSPIFHGRDIFSPCGAHLAAGVPLQELGTPIKEIIHFQIPKPQKNKDMITGEVIHIDHYGNLICNIRREDIQELGLVEVKLGKQTIGPIYQTFGDRHVGQILALYSPHYYLMIAVTNGNAQEQLGAKVGDSVTVVRISN